MAEFNTKIELNEKVIFLVEPKNKLLEEEFFNLFINKSQTYILNDDGDENELKEELKEFDISPDKELGHEWHFKINEKSKEIIKKTFKSNLSIGHRKWTLKGKDFSLKYIECGDMHDLMDGPIGQKTIYNHFIIKVEGDNLESINSILKSYETEII